MKQDYGKENEVIKSDEEGNVTVPFSREEFENFHALYVQYNESVKALITKVYKELKGDIKKLQKEVAALREDNEKMKEETNKLREEVKQCVKKDNYAANRAADIVAAAELAIATVKEIVSNFFADVRCATIWFAVLVPLMASIGLFAAIYGTGYW